LVHFGAPLHRVIILVDLSIVKCFGKFIYYNLLMKIFGERLKELRNEKGLSTKALGATLGVSGAAVTHWELNQADITAENLVKVAKFYSVTADYLLGLEE